MGLSQYTMLSHSLRRQHAYHGAVSAHDAVTLTAPSAHISWGCPCTRCCHTHCTVSTHIMGLSQHTMLSHTLHRLHAYHGAVPAHNAVLLVITVTSATSEGNRSGNCDSQSYLVITVTAYLLPSNPIPTPGPPPAALPIAASAGQLSGTVRHSSSPRMTPVCGCWVGPGFPCSPWTWPARA